LRIYPTGGEDRPDKTIEVAFSTNTTKVAGAVVSTLRHGMNVHPVGTANSPKVEGLTARQAVTFPVREGGSYELVKYVGVDTALTSRAPREAALRASQAAAATGWPQLLAGNALEWRKLWRSDIAVAGRPELQAWVRAAPFSLLASSRRGQDTSIAPAARSSDNYGGPTSWVA